MPFQPGNTEGAKSRRAKPYADALRMEAAALANDEVVTHPRGSLRAIAQMRLLTAASVEGHADAKEVADRLDGKVPQAIVGDDDHPGVKLETVQRTIVDPNQGRGAAADFGDTNSASVPPPPGTEPV